jgi:hypothetical protein
MSYSAIFDNVFQALNLVLNFSYLAMAFGSSPKHRALPCLAIGDFRHIMKSANPGVGKNKFFMRQQLVLSVACR